MSLSSTPAIAQYRLGILAAKDFDSPQVLDDLLGAKLDQISHLFTNGANGLITDFARVNGLTHTVIPVHGGRGLPASTRDIVEASDVVVIISTPGSKSASQIEKACRDRAAKDPAFKWRVEAFDPASHWKSKVHKVCEILSCLNREELKDSAWAAAVWREVSI